MYQNRQDYDNDAWDLNDDVSSASIKRLSRTYVCDEVVAAVASHFGAPASPVTPLRMGGYNMLYRISVSGLKNDILVRVPCPNLSQFPEEKTRQEVATIQLLRENTALQVPECLHSGRHTFGPFIFLPFIQNRGDMSDALSKPREDSNEVPVLDEDIDEDLLRELYSKMAASLIQLWQVEFPSIGSLTEDAGSVSVASRPVTLNMSNMVQLGNIPRCVLPPEDTTYATADEWYIALAEMHIAQLVFQHNDLVSSEEDCANKYVSRILFRRLAKEGKLSTFGFAQDDWSVQSRHMAALCPAPKSSESFRLWCDDLRPNSFLVDESNEIVSVIDWEFTYSAPTQFILDPPWWLLLDVPEMWSAGMIDWTKKFEKRLETWISSMKMAEESAGQNVLPFTLSEYMRESWTTGRFWLSYAARKSWAFDAIFWNHLDARFFGKRMDDGPLWKCRLALLTDDETIGLEQFVQRKMEESKERRLVSWEGEEARSRLRDLLF